MMIRSAGIAALLVCSSLACAQDSPIEITAWGARIEAGEGPDSEASVCDLEPGQMWTGTASGRGSVQSSDGAFQIEVDLSYVVNPDGDHEIQATFESSAQRLDDFTVYQGWATRYMVQIETDSPVRFEMEITSTLSNGATEAEVAVGAFIQNGLQSWILRNRCPLDVFPYLIEPWDSDTSVLQIVQYDIHTDQTPFVLRIGDGVDYGQYGEYLTQSGVGLSSGTIQPGIYTIYLFSYGGGSTEQDFTGEGVVSLRLIPLDEICVADLDANGTLDETDAMQFLSQRPDLNADMEFDFFDVSMFIEAFTSGCSSVP